MDLQNIQDQLNTEFSKEETRIIFWFDDKGEYEDEVSELQLDNAKLHILDGTNWFYSKWLLNESDTESKYLVYAPFPKPSDAENPLADMYYYSVPYYTDRVSQMSQEIGIDNRFKEHLAQYSNFWKNKDRIEKGVKPEDTTCDAHKGNAELTINPFDELSVRKIKYKADGSIYSDDADINEDVTEILNLNCEAVSLPETRKNVLNVLKNEIAEKCKGKSHDVYIRELERIYDRLVYQRNLTPYCGIIISWLEEKL